MFTKSSQLMEPKTFMTVEMAEGEVLRVEDVDGVQCADIGFFSLSDYRRKRAEHGERPIPQSALEHYSQAVTASRNRHVYLGLGRSLYSTLCNPVATIVGDTVGHHDVISAWCNPETNFSRWGDSARGRRTCKENIQDAMAPYGVEVAIPCTFNIFMNFSITPEGEIQWLENLSKPGDYIDLRVDMDVVVAISNCPQEMNAVNGFEPTRLRVSVLTDREPVAPASSPA
jgi:uncharacterized protein YcgI (DUF1989 family)